MSYSETLQVRLAQAEIEREHYRMALEAMTRRKDEAYLERNRVVSALAKCFPSGIAKTSIAGWSADWHGCVFIDLPSGQVSWHYHDSQAYLFSDLPPYWAAWDGHDTEEKYRRVDSLTMGSLEKCSGDVDHAIYYLDMVGLHYDCAAVKYLRCQFHYAMSHLIAMKNKEDEQ